MLIKTCARRARVSRMMLLATAGGLALAACSPKPAQAPAALAPLASLPLAQDAGVASAPAPLAQALPPAPRARTGRLATPDDQYAYADRAQAMSEAFGDAPPDYTFDYGGGEQPWVWRGDDQSTRVAEPLPDGSYRYYYYEPGADTPYLVQDPGYGYGYDNGVLVVIYDAQGRPMPAQYVDRDAVVAGQFLYRAQQIYQAALNQRRQAVAQAQWAARANIIAAEQSRWVASQSSDPGWSAYHAAHAQQEQAQWAAEQARRQAQAARYAAIVNPPAGPQGAYPSAPRPSPPQGPATSAPPAYAGAPAPAPAQQQAAAQARQAQALAQAQQAQAQAQAARQAEAQTSATREAQAQAARQAQAQTQAQAQAARQAEAQAASARQAQAAEAQAQTARHAEAQASAAREAQAQAARQAQAQTQAQTQARAQAQAQAQASAARQAETQAVARQAQAEAARQAQAQAARVATAEAARKAEAAKTAPGQPSKPVPEKRPPEPNTGQP